MKNEFSYELVSCDYFSQIKRQRTKFVCITRDEGDDLLELAQDDT